MECIDQHISKNFQVVPQDCVPGLLFRNFEVKFVHCGLHSLPMCRLSRAFSSTTTSFAQPWSTVSDYLHQTTSSSECRRLLSYLTTLISQTAWGTRSAGTQSTLSCSIPCPSQHCQSYATTHIWTMNTGIWSANYNIRFYSAPLAPVSPLLSNLWLSSSSNLCATSHKVATMSSRPLGSPTRSTCNFPR